MTHLGKGLFAAFLLGSLAAAAPSPAQQCAPRTGAPATQDFATEWSSRDKGVAGAAAMCADGTCDAPLDLAIWSGAWTGDDAGAITDANLPAGPWTAGILPNDNSIPSNASCGSGTSHAAQAHHSIVPAGFDPEIVTLSTVAPVPVGNPSSLRLGNRCTLNGGERVTKTFTVAAGATSLQFWYATVFQDPGHRPANQPGFGVYLLNGGTPIAGRVDLDPSTAGFQDFVVADAANPFFGVKPATTGQETVVWRDWTCVIVDLSGLEGQTLTLVLANRDCNQGGHWGYSYVDSFCLGCAGNPTGSASWSQAASSCATGKICFDYTVPRLANGTTGTAQLSLTTFQNGTAVSTYSSGTLTADGTYCFPNVLGGLAGGTGFDWQGTADFAIPGATIAPIQIGQQGTGVIAGQNNDCPVSTPPTPVNPCCPPWNPQRVADSLFYAGSGPITAPYTLHFVPSLALQTQMKAYIDYLHAVNPAIPAITINWRLHDQGTGTLPTPSLGPQVNVSAFTTWPSGGSGLPIIGGDPTFFSLPNPYPMVVGTWYRVHTGIYLENGQTFFGDLCANNDIWVRVQVLTAATGGEGPVLEILGGGGAIRRIPLPLK